MSISQKYGIPTISDPRTMQGPVQQKSGATGISAKYGIKSEGTSTVATKGPDVLGPELSGQVNAYNQRQQAEGSLFSRGAEQYLTGDNTWDRFKGLGKMAGGAIKGAFDTVVEPLVKPAFDYAINPAVKMVQKGLDVASQPIQNVIHSALGNEGLKKVQNATSNIISKGENFYKGMTQDQKDNVDALFQIASVLPIGEMLKGGAAALTEGAAKFIPEGISSGIADVAKAIPEHVATGIEGQIAKRSENFAQDLIAPVENKKLRVEALKQGRVNEGLFGGTIAPSQQEHQIAQDVAKLPLKTQSFLGGKNETANIPIIRKGIQDESTYLRTALRSEGSGYTPQEINNIVKQAKQTASANPFLTGDAGRSYDRVLQGFDSELRKITDSLPKGQKPSIADLDQARINFDKWLTSQKPKFFEGSSENAVHTAATDLRTAVNDFIASKTKSVDVKESLRKMSNYYRAIDMVSNTAGTSKLGVISKLWNKMSPTTKTFLGGGAVGGAVVGGLPAILGAIPEIVGIAGTAAAGRGIYLGGKALYDSIPKLIRYLQKEEITAAPERAIEIANDLKALGGVVIEAGKNQPK